MARRRMLIVTADDFGLHEDVNEAVERAHCHGILNAASLMISAPSTADAVVRAHRLPGLRVGLHLVLADGWSTLPWESIPDLVDIDGRFGDAMVRDGMRFALYPALRAQLAAEIHAQFEAFARTGLALDHVNAHMHFHLHPTVLGLILRIGRDFGLQAMRLPREAGGPLLLRPWLALLRRRLERAGIAHNDFVIGLSSSGAMDETAVLAALDRLPHGVVEMYLHPAVSSGARIGASMPGYRHADELAALLSPRVRAVAERVAPRRGGFADLLAA
ncbi:MAG: hopanoid biosynthesis-associated protein HpnK [Cupriavidus sp.]|nr:hopanoid biosynthesis-associated protein HpnK [Cupriavidus sp.]